MSPEELLDEGRSAMAPTLTHTGKARSKWDALDEFMWTYHDKHPAHTGGYAYCDMCTYTIAFFRDNPDWNKA